jgi:hypothetical protein
VRAPQSFVVAHNDVTAINSIAAIGYGTGADNNFAKGWSALTVVDLGQGNVVR